jgi:hypothetical protein
MILRMLACAAVALFTVACDDYGSGGTFGTSPGTGAATKLGFTVQPSLVTAGSPITPAVQVAVQNASGATVTSATTAVTVSLTTGTGTNGAILGGTRTVTAVNGVAAFPGLTVDRSGVGYTLTASGTNLTSGTSAQFTVNP